MYTQQTAKLPIQDYGIWVPGIPVLLESGLDAIGCADWLKGLIT